MALLQRALKLALAAVLCSPLVNADVHNLSNLQWTLKNQNGSIVIPAKVPSQVHLDLLDAGVITEPLLGVNDFTQRWIVNDNWTYTADLAPLTHDLAGNTKALLVFYGLDTIADINVAGHEVAWVNNQFRQYVFEVTDMVSSPVQDNTNITVAFESAWLYGLNVTARPDVDTIFNIDFEYPGVRQVIRKMQSDFGWDWGPAFVPSGIFKPAYLVTLSEDPNTQAQPASHPLLASTGAIFFEETSLEISKAGQTSISTPDQSADWLVNITLVVRSVVAADSPTVTVTIPELDISSGPLSVSAVEANTDAPTTLRASFKVPEGVPARWFPHNLGTPKLYNFTIALDLDEANSASFVMRSGFRTIELVQTAYSQEEIDARGITPGDHWHFEVNGQAFYALGTSVIPFDPFYARVSQEQVRWVLESAIASGQNMVRVWGGGIYQPSDELTGGYDFYSVCDELGILAWSELIFSDNSYPTNGFLLDNIEPEVRQNIRRVNRHPSNAQWAGANELEIIVLLIDEAWNNATSKQFMADFQFLFGEYLRDIVLQEQNSVAYTDSSFTFGVLSLDPYEIRYRNQTPGFIYGNFERYNYDASQAFNYSTYPVTRLVSEFGFHSLPSIYAWEEVLQNPEDFSFNSTVVASRDHHPPAGSLSFPNPNAHEGQAEMTQAVELWLPTPGTTDTNQTFAQWCWSTQIFQSLNMAAEIAWYRRGAGLGENNLGALVWQMNDIWQGVSWSAMEHSGRWKVLQYELANIFSPVAAYPFWYANNETLQVLVMSDRLEPVSGNAQMTWYDWAGNVLNSSVVPFDIPSLNGTVVFDAVGLDSILPAGADANDVFMLVNVTAQVDGGRTITQEQYFAPVSLAQANLVDPAIKMTTGNDLTFTLSAQGGVAAFAWIDHPAGTVGYFKDVSTGGVSNGFFLIPGIDRTLQFVMNPALSKVTDPNPLDFVVRSLWNNTHL